jgi:FkbM family methyltransferase
VHAFECDPRLVGRLREHVSRAELSWVRVNEAAVYESSGRELTFRLTDQVGWGSVEDEVWEASGVASVASVALDDYLADLGIAPERVSLVKIDVEGAERPALAGMASVLEQGSPAVLVEIVPWRLENQGRTVDELVEFMASHGYEPWSPVRFERGRVEYERGARPALGEDVLFLKGRAPL